MRVGPHNLLDRLLPKHRKGSKPRCHWLTFGSEEQIASRLHGLAQPHGSVSADDCWMPQGFNQLKEAELDKAPGLLPQQDRDKLRDWWLAKSDSNSQTPNWDIASTCIVDGRKGLLLVEAKAHHTEMNDKESTTASPRNRKQIAERIEEANISLANQTGFNWGLSHEHHYQMSNRFAWSWKLTELGYPVILVYLGFVGAEEMRSGEEQVPFSSHAEWEEHVKAHSDSLFPAEIWNRRWDVHGQPFVPRICSMEISGDGPIREA